MIVSGTRWNNEACHPWLNQGTKSSFLYLYFLTPPFSRLPSKFLIPVHLFWIFLKSFPTILVSSILQTLFWGRERTVEIPERCTTLFFLLLGMTLSHCCLSHSTPIAVPLLGFGVSGSVSRSPFSSSLCSWNKTVYWRGKSTVPFKLEAWGFFFFLINPNLLSFPNFCLFLWLLWKVLFFFFVNPF